MGQGNFQNLHANRVAAADMRLTSHDRDAPQSFSKCNRFTFEQMQSRLQETLRIFKAYMQVNYRYLHQTVHNTPRRVMQLELMFYCWRILEIYKYEIYTKSKFYFLGGVVVVRKSFCFKSLFWREQFHRAPQGKGRSDHTSPGENICRLWRWLSPTGETNPDIRSGTFSLKWPAHLQIVKFSWIINKQKKKKRNWESLGKFNFNVNS